MNYLPYLEFSTGYVDLPGANDLVHADLLAEAVNDGCQCWINRIIDWMGSLTRESDGQLRDNIVRLRSLSDEVLEAFPSYDSFHNARLSSLAYVVPAGLSPVDGVLPQEDDIILLMGQGGADDGLYKASAGLWLRVDDFADGYIPDGTVHVWVTEGTSRGFTSWVWNAPSRSVVGTTEQGWVLFHAEYRASITQDLADALQGTEGIPNNSNRFVTDQDLRLDPFDYNQDGLVPGPAAVAGDLRFLCEDGTWKIPDIITIVGNVVRTDLDSFMDSGVSIHFDATGTIDGIPDPVNPSEVANMNYVDVTVAPILVDLGLLVNWKTNDLDGIAGLIFVDGAGGYSQFNNIFTNLTITNKLTVGGLIDPTGLQLTPVAVNPGDPNTLWVDNGPGDLWFGPGNLTGSILANAGAAAAAQATANAAKAVTDALGALTGLLVCNGAGVYSAIALPGGGTTFLRDDGVFSAPTVAPASRGEAYGAPAPLALTGPGTWDLVAIPNGGLVNNMTFIGNGLRADANMSVRLVASISGDLNAAQAVDWGIAVNGAPAGIIAKSVQREHYGGIGTQPNVTTLTCELDLVATDVVTLWGQQVAGSATFTFTNINMNVRE